jgi:hypothetical protein
MNEEKQAASVRALWEFLNQNRLVGRTFGTSANGTGDGAVLAFANRGSGQMSHAGLIEHACNLVAWMRGKRPPTGIRIGLHIGDFRQLSLGPPAGIQLVGTGLNECTRIATIGDAEHIIVSEEFVENWQKHGDLREHVFSPALGDEPVIVFVKHDEPRGVRVYVPKELNQNEMPTPARLKRLLAVDRLIMRTLQEIEGTLLKSICTLTGHSASNGDIDGLRSKLSPRISIFTRRQHKGIAKLGPTKYRYHTEAALRSSGKTMYALAPKPEGPAARAFLSRDVFVAHGFPDPATDRNAYLGQMSSENISAEMVGAMSRLSRAFIDIPFGLVFEEVSPPSPIPERGDPDGIICIDFADELSALNGVEWRTLGQEIQKQYNTLITSLWKLRTT